MHLPAYLVYPFIRWGAKMFADFDLEECSPLLAVQHCNVPIIFFHGDADSFVPKEMSERLYEACKSKKELHIVKGAAHGLAYPVDKEGYIQAIENLSKEFNK